MRKPVALLLCCLAAGNAWAESPKSDVPLWPEIEPFKTGYLKVSKLHELYYELSGNQDGKPILYLHGGPGGMSSPYARRFFNPERFLIVAFDQRGSGKSKPYAEWRENTTDHLVQDIERLRKHLNLKKLILFGGSWGATLALAYAQRHPDRVAGLVLRGVFTATQAEIDHFYHGGVRPFFPDAYDRLLAALPDPKRRPLPAYLDELIRKGTKADQKKYSLAWARYEIKIAGLNIPDAAVEDILKGFDPLSFGLLENYYMAHACFLEEGQLFKNAKKIAHIRTVIVNGRYDVICPPTTARRLHELLPKSTLVIAEGAGHWMGEKPVERALLRTMREFE